MACRVCGTKSSGRPRLGTCNSVPCLAIWAEVSHAISCRHCHGKAEVRWSRPGYGFFDYPLSSLIHLRINLDHMVWESDSLRIRAERSFLIQWEAYCAITSADDLCDDACPGIGSMEHISLDDLTRYSETYGDILSEELETKPKRRKSHARR